MKDRSIQPEIATDYALNFPKVNRTLLENGMQLFLLKGSNSGIVKIDLLWPGGRVTEKYPAQARSAMKSLSDGFPGMQSYALAEFFDFYGASVGHGSSIESLSSSLSVLSKHIETVLPKFLQSIFEVKVSLKEFRNRQQIFSEKLNNELQKNDVVAYRVFTESLFGTDHAYGYNTEPKDYLDLENWMVMDYLNSHISTDKCKVIISGDLDDKTRNSIINLLEELPRKRNKCFLPIIEPEDIEAKNITLAGHQPHQISFRLGRKLFSRTHPEYQKMKLVNALLGGYFGSRLMTNIREDKGYCYNIDSSLDCMSADGYFSIGADINAESLEDCIGEIKKELKLLQTTLVEDEELNRLKQYIKGQILMAIDGVFSAGDVLKKYLKNNLDEMEFYKQINVLNTISPHDIQALASKYYNFEDFLLVCVGGQN